MCSNSSSAPSAGSPSPLVPSLIVFLLIMAAYGPRIMNSAAFVSDVQETTVSFAFTIPLLTVLIIYYVSENILLPLILILVVYFVSGMLMGPLILLVVIHVLSTFFPSGQSTAAESAPSYAEREEQQYNGEKWENGEGEGLGWWGWGTFWLLLLFFTLLKVYSNK
ncbi:hypothetical protein ACLOJK_030281 [Asimina triloba]